MANLPDPITRKEQYLSVMAENTAQYPEEPITREEMYLDYLCKNGTGGGSVTPEQIQAAVDAYLGENPVSADLPQVDHGTADTTFTLPANEIHTWGEVASLTLTLAAEETGVANGYWFSFDSGDTATTLSLPDTVQTDIVVEPNTHYECMIVNDYMTFYDWEVSA